MAKGGWLTNTRRHSERIDEATGEVSRLCELVRAREAASQADVRVHDQIRKLLTDKTAELAAELPQVKLLRTIPGVGVILAARPLAQSGARAHSGM